VRLRESGEDLSGPSNSVPSSRVFSRAALTTRDGSLKTVHYTKGCARFGAYMIEWVRAETPVSQLTRIGCPSTRRPSVGQG